MRLSLACLIALLGCSSPSKKVPGDTFGTPQFAQPVPEDPRLSIDASGQLLIVDFGYVLAHTGRASTHMFLLQHPGPRTLTLLGLNKGADFDDAFQVPSPEEVRQNIPPGGSIALFVAFKPTVGKDYAATFTLPTNRDASPDEPALKVVLQGSGVDHACVLNPPDLLDFGNIKAGVRGEQRLVVQNTSPLDWTFTLGGFTGDDPDAFTTDPAPGEVTIKANDSLAITVAFSGQHPGVASAELHFTSAGDMCGPTPLLLRARSVDSLVTATPNPVDFGQVDPAAGWARQEVTLTNIGNDPLHLLPADSGALCDGAWAGSDATCVPSAEFATAPDGTTDPAALDFTLAPAASKTLTLYFRPARTHAAQGHLQLKLEGGVQPSFGFSLVGVGASP